VSTVINGGFRSGARGDHGEGGRADGRERQESTIRAMKT
jgi:hypothetical protein